MTSTRFEDRVVVATGAASGLGLATVRQFAAEGAHLVLVDRAEQALMEVVAELVGNGTKAVAVVGDVSRAATATRAVQTALTEFGRVDVLFEQCRHRPVGGHHSGRDKRGVVGRGDRRKREVRVPIREASDPCDDRRRRRSHREHRVLRRTEGFPPGGGLWHLQGRGHRPDSGAGPRLHAQGIRTNAICPGFLECITTDRRATMTEEQKSARRALAGTLVPLGREGSYEEVARSILFLASPESSYTSGAALLIDGGWIA